MPGAVAVSEVERVRLRPPRRRPCWVRWVDDVPSLLSAVRVAVLEDPSPSGASVDAMGRVVLLLVAVTRTASSVSPTAALLFGACFCDEVEACLSEPPFDCLLVGDGVGASSVAEVELAAVAAVAAVAEAFLRRLFEAADVPDVPEDSIAPEPLGAVGVVDAVVVAAVEREVAATAVVAAAEDDDVELAALASARLLLSSFLVLPLAGFFVRRL